MLQLTRLLPSAEFDPDIEAIARSWKVREPASDELHRWAARDGISYDEAKRRALLYAMPLVAASASEAQTVFIDQRVVRDTEGIAGRTRPRIDLTPRQFGIWVRLTLLRLATESLDALRTEDGSSQDVYSVAIRCDSRAELVQLPASLHEPSSADPFDDGEAGDWDDAGADEEGSEATEAQVAADRLEHLTQHLPREQRAVIEAHLTLLRRGETPTHGAVGHLTGKTANNVRQQWDKIKRRLAASAGTTGR